MRIPRAEAQPLGPFHLHPRMREIDAGKTCVGAALCPPFGGQGLTGQMSKSNWTLTNGQLGNSMNKRGLAVADDLAAAQALRYAEELRTLYAEERKQRRAAERTLEQLGDSYSTTVRALAAALELRDDETGGHAERVTRLALELARSIDPGLLDDPQLEYGFLLHDLGKIGVPDSILLKPGPLTARERETMRDHPILGERIVARVPYLRG